MASPRFFLAHAKGVEDEAMAELERAARVVLDPNAKGRPYELVFARDYHRARFADCGSWAAWTGEVARGIDPIARVPIFTAILIPAGRVGAATAEIVNQACVAGKPVFAFDLTGASWPALGADRVDTHDWKTGWELRRGGASHG